MPDLAPFRRKPCRVEAIQYDGTNAKQIKQLFPGRVEHDRWEHEGRRGNVKIQVLQVTTDIGKIGNVRPTDWVIQGVEGEIYPCRNEIFEKIYEPLAENPTHDQP